MLIADRQIVPRCEWKWGSFTGIHGGSSTNESPAALCTRPDTSASPQYMYPPDLRPPSMTYESVKPSLHFPQCPIHSDTRASSGHALRASLSALNYGCPHHVGFLCKLRPTPGAFIHCKAPPEPWSLQVSPWHHYNVNVHVTSSPTPSPTTPLIRASPKYQCKPCISRT